MDVHAYSRLVESHNHNEISGFPADSRQFTEILNGPRYSPIEQSVEGFGELFQVLCLGAVETDRKEKLFQFPSCYAIEIGGFPDSLEKSS